MSSLFDSILSDVQQFAVPFARTVINQSTTPAQMQAQRLSDAALNGSGPNDPTLANQSPQGLTNFLTGARTSGGPGTKSTGNWLTNNMGMVIVSAVALVAVILVLRK